jgi:hypothetical protein
MAQRSARGRAVCRQLYKVSEILAGGGAELAAHLRDWISVQHKAGARLFALEGLMQSGKTTLAKKVRTVDPMIVRIELDDFIDPRGAHLPRTWDEAFDQAAAVRHIRMMLERDRTVLYAGTPQRFVKRRLNTST